jgi:5-methylcytosine-specific restriction endonuclease McrA
MANGLGHSGHAYRILWQQVMAPRPLICWLCHCEIDTTLRYPDPGSRALHCVIPVSRGGRLNWENAVPTHRHCNLRQGNRLPDEGPFATGPVWVAELEP